MASLLKKRDGLAETVRSAGFTPSVRDVPELLELLAAATEDDVVEDVERALVRIGDKGIAKLVAAADAAPPLRGRICRVIGRFAPASEDARGFLLAALGDADAKTRRNAIIALGKVPEGSAAAVEDALLAAWVREERPEHKRSIAASLGKIGSPRSLERLRALDAGDAKDPELARIAGRAVMMLERDDLRAAKGGIDGDRAPAAPTQMLAYCRAGLEEILADELADAEIAGPGIVQATLREPLASVFAARTMLRFAFPLPPERMRGGEDLGAALVRAVTSEAARRIFETWTVGPKRYRIAFAGGGHRRALVWRCAKEIAEARPDLVNDPTESTWELTARERCGFVEVEMTPRALVDPRFAYRRGDVPAASHPTLAAALARVAGTDPRDVVWDPFVGSATELIERSLAGPYARLLGSDVDARAVEIARGNLEAAGVRATLSVEDATVATPEGVTLVITNPPMGRRVARGADLASFFDRFIDHVARVLVPGGRLVWISPLPERTAERATRAGLRVELTQTVDMGGFPAQIQRARKPVSSGGAGA